MPISLSQNVVEKPNRAYKLLFVNKRFQICCQFYMDFQETKEQTNKYGENFQLVPKVRYNVF